MSIFSVVTPASSLALLTAAQLRQAAGLAAGDTSQDTDLAVLGLQAASLLTSACNVARDGNQPPTLLAETCQEIFRYSGGWYPGYWGTSYSHPLEPMSQPKTLLLARRPIASIVSVVEDGTTLASTDYEILDKATGLLQRLNNGWPVEWWAQQITVQYVAGWSSVQANLVLAVQKQVRWMLAEAGKNPMAARELVTIPGVRTVDTYFGSVSRTASSGDLPAVPSQVLELLTEYMTQAVG